MLFKILFLGLMATVSSIRGEVVSDPLKKVSFAEGDSLQRVREYDPEEAPSEVGQVNKTGLDKYAVEKPESEHSQYISPKIGRDRIELSGFYGTGLIDRSQLRELRSDKIETLRSDLKKKGQNPDDYDFYAKPYVLKSDDDEEEVLPGRYETIVGEKKLTAGVRDAVKSAGNVLSKTRQRFKNSISKAKIKTVKN